MVATRDGAVGGRTRSMTYTADHLQAAFLAGHIDIDRLDDELGLAVGLRAPVLGESITVQHGRSHRIVWVRGREVCTDSRDPSWQHIELGEPE